MGILLTLLHNSVFTSLLGSVTGAIIGALATNLGAKKAWLREKRFHCYMYSIKHLKMAAKIHTNINNGLYNGAAGKEAKNEDFDKEGEIVDFLLGGFEIISEPEVFDAYTKALRDIQCKNKDANNVVEEYSKIVNKSVCGWRCLKGNVFNRKEK